jgi:dTDP-4-dehydrorhamnose 3,5-epimerase
MNFIPQSIPDVLLIEPVVHGDERGYFVETFRQQIFEETVRHHVELVQDNESRSSKGVLRGLHFQLPPYAQSKLVRVLEGTVQDVTVDIRVGSPTYGQHLSVELSAENKKQLWIPRGFAHGFVVLSKYATFSYKVDNYYSPESDRGISYNDPDLNIDWQLPIEIIQLSDKDQKQPKFKELTSCFQYGEDLYG